MRFSRIIASEHQFLNRILEIMDSKNGVDIVLSQKHSAAVIALLSLLLIGAGCASTSSRPSSGYDSPEPVLRYGSLDEEEMSIDRDDAIDEYWDEIKDYLSGTEELEACSSDSGNCYYLDSEISQGRVEQVYFSNGGYLYFSADIDERGDASDSDQDGNYWDFELDMDSSMVDDAVEEWADDNGYTIE